MSTDPNCSGPRFDREYAFTAKQLSHPEFAETEPLGLPSVRVLDQSAHHNRSNLMMKLVLTTRVHFSGNHPTGSFLSIPRAGAS
jgi:hypothetical protein